MSRTDPFLLAGALVVFITVYGGLPWLSGGLFLDTHEGDIYHLLDILIRMESGAVPHIDFVTPIGALAFWPVAWIMGFGVSAGKALILAQLAVAFLLLPLVLYVALTRLTRGLAIFFGCTTLGLVLALSYGTATSGVGISMHYNRWSWAVSFVLLALALLPARGTPRAGLEGVLIGSLGAVLLLLKITYFVTLIPVVILSLVLSRNWSALAAALVTGCVAVAVVTLVNGIGFWTGYLQNVLLVAGSEIRPSAGTPLVELVAEPRNIGATLAGIAAILTIRKAGPPAVGLAVFLLVPAFIYITYQNFGTDPQWMLFLPVLLLALRPEAGREEIFGADLRQAMTMVAVAGFALFFPSFFNIATSPLAHLSFDKSRFLPALPQVAGFQDVRIRRDRAYLATAQIFKDQEPGPWEPFAAVVGRKPVSEFHGVRFPECEFGAGSRALLETIGADLAEAGLPAGSGLFTADLLGAYHLFSPLEAPQGSAPWYYGGLTGFADTDYVLVPKCAFVASARRIILEELKASDATFTLVRDNALYALYEVGD